MENGRDDLRKSVVIGLVGENNGRQLNEMELILLFSCVIPQSTANANIDDTVNNR